MYSEAFRAAVATACPKQYPVLRQRLYSAHLAGHITDAEVEALDGLLNLSAEPASPYREARPRIRRGTIFPPRPAVRRPDPSESVRRRRYHAQGALPPSLAVSFTVGELSVLAIVGAEMAANGLCDRSLAEIAARAGVCRSLVQRAMKAARAFGLLTITPRPRRGQKNLTNVVRIVDSRWLAWLAGPTGSTNVNPTKTTRNSKGKRQQFAPLAGSRVAKAFVSPVRSTTGGGLRL